jgi:hypothetical protein
MGRVVTSISQHRLLATEARLRILYKLKLVLILYCLGIQFTSTIAQIVPRMNERMNYICILLSCENPLIAL